MLVFSDAERKNEHTGFFLLKYRCLKRPVMTGQGECEKGSRVKVPRSPAAVLEELTPLCHWGNLGRCAEAMIPEPEDLPVFCTAKLYG